MRRILSFFLVFLLATAAVETDAVAVARAAVESWLKSAGKLPEPTALLEKDPKAALKALKRMMAFPPPPKGLEVNLDEPRVEKRGAEVWVRFPAALGESTGEVVVRVKDGEAVGILWRPAGGMLPGWLRSPWSGPVFALLALAVLLSVFRGRLRRAFLEAVLEVRRRRGLFFLTQALLFFAFFLGAVAAYSSPELARMIQEYVGLGLLQIGLEDAARYGPLGLAAVIFYWNFTHGLFLTTFLPALLFGVPAVLLNFFRYLVLGVALSPALIPWDRFLLHLPVILLELGAYNTVAFGGLALLAEVAAGRGFRSGLRVLLKTFFLGTVLLLLAAFYEAFEVLL